MEFLFEPYLVKMMFDDPVTLQWLGGLSVGALDHFAPIVAACVIAVMGGRCARGTDHAKGEEEPV